MDNEVGRKKFQIIGSSPTAAKPKLSGRDDELFGWSASRWRVYDDVVCCQNPDRSIVKHRWTINPLHHRIDRGLGQERMTTNHSRILDGSIGIDQDFEGHNPANLSRFRQFGIYSFHPTYQLPFLNLSTDPDRSLRFRVGPKQGDEPF